jgi:predicted Zn-dependent protease with MMP-like domain
MTVNEFKRIARDAITSIPEEFQPYLKDVAIVVEPYASDELLKSLGVPESEDIYGLYEGVSLIERNESDAPQLPPRIILYFEPFMEDCESEEEMIHEIQTTVLHEIGHHFGLDEERLTELGYD